MTVVIPERVALRAFERWTPAPSGCYISTYSVASHGYAQIGWQKLGRTKGTTAHRAAWTYVHGQIPDGTHIDHRCYERRCVRVDHLRMLSVVENSRRTGGRDWPVGLCAQGHDVTHWKPKSPERLKGYCARCRMEARARRRGTLSIDEALDLIA